MKPNINLITIFTLTGLSSLFANDLAFFKPTTKFIMLGPRVNYNFGGNQDFFKNFSIGLEVSYWQTIFYGANLGLEYSSSKLNFYSEAQIGTVVTGLSIGPYINLKSPEQKIGLQSTYWLTIPFLGLQHRYNSNENNNYSLGYFLSAPLYNETYSVSEADPFYKWAIGL